MTHERLADRPQMTKPMTVFMNIRITPEMMTKVQRLADEQGRSTAGMVRMLMRYGIEWVEREAAGKKEARRG